MALNPIPVLIVLVVTNVFGGLIAGENVVVKRFDEISDPTENGDCGFFCIEAVEVLAAIIQAVWATFLTIFDFLTFNITGAPAWLRAMIGFPVSGALVWSVVGTVTGS